jgi:hypothetical protein
MSYVYFIIGLLLCQLSFSISRHFESIIQPGCQVKEKENVMSKTKLNYWLDVIIAFAFILAALSGVVFLFAGSGGYQGGRNPSFRTELLGVSRQTWSDLHTWTGLVMMTGVPIHLVLHWQWIQCMPRKYYLDGLARNTKPQ